MDRRQFLLSAAAGSLAWAAGAPFVAAAPFRKKAVIVGGGVAGSILALDLKRRVPEADVVLVEREAEFFLAAASVDVAVGAFDMRAAMRGYHHLANRGIQVVRAEAQGVDPKAGLLQTSAGPIPYSLLAIASGIRLAFEEIPGLKDDPGANLSFYDRTALPALQKGLADMKGGNVIVSVPAGALRCPPAPYEFALRVADLMTARRLEGKVILIDGWPSPQPEAIGKALAAEIAARGERIEYIPQTTVGKVDPKGRKVTTDFDQFDYEILTLTPPTKGGSLVAELGLADKGDVFAAVDYLTLRSKAHENIFVLGDAARVPYGKSGTAAVGQARLCAAEMAHSLDGFGRTIRQGEVQVSCYHAVRPGAALRLSTGYRSTRKPDGGVDVMVRAEAGTRPDPANEFARLSWHREILWEIGG
ncbi:MAG: FAD-dependent oxidoreductase [Magnetospirillum sp. WYHS-4]